MAKKPRKGRAPDNTEELERPKNRGHENIKPFIWEAGKSGNPAGRPKGSRTVFAETFVKDFMADWELYGAQAVAKVREEDTTNYVKVAATLLPKDFNLNLTNEANLDKILSKFDDAQLRTLLTGLVAAGST